MSFPKLLLTGDFYLVLGGTLCFTDWDRWQASPTVLTFIYLVCFLAAGHSYSCDEREEERQREGQCQWRGITLVMKNNSVEEPPFFSAFFPLFLSLGPQLPSLFSASTTPGIWCLFFSFNTDDTVLLKSNKETKTSEKRKERKRSKT